MGRACAGDGEGSEPARTVRLLRRQPGRQIRNNVGARTGRAVRSSADLGSNSGHSLDMMVKDLLESAEFRRLFRRNAETYRRKFTAIASKSDALTLDISDPTLLAKLLRPSWNWAAFFGISYWGIYWRLRVGWLFVGISFVLAVLESLPALPNFIPSLDYVTLGFAIFFGLYANSYLFRELVQRARNDQLARFSPSFSMAFAVLLASLALPLALALADPDTYTPLISLLSATRMITH
jgi:hypothetical protein